MSGLTRSALRAGDADADRPRTVGGPPSSQRRHVVRAGGPQRGSGEGRDDDASNQVSHRAADQLGLKTTVWIECGSELISTDEAPTTREYCPPRGVGFMTTTATVPSSLTKPVVSSMLRLGDARIRLAPGRMNFEKWPM